MSIELVKETKIAIRCWRDGNLFFKQLPAYNADNEVYFLEALQYSGYVPRWPNRRSRELISMEFVKPERVTDPDEFFWHFDLVLKALEDSDICHGDLTEYSVLVKNNKPILVDFAEARILSTTWMLPPKRPEGDKWWLERTMRKLAYGS